MFRFGFCLLYSCGFKHSLELRRDYRVRVISLRYVWVESWVMVCHSYVGVGVE